MHLVFASPCTVERIQFDHSPDLGILTTVRVISVSVLHFDIEFFVAHYQDDVE